jgi:hypothetical protein
MTDEIESLEAFHQQLNKDLTTQPQSSLIARSGDLVRQLKDLHNKPAASKFTLP